MNKKNSSKIVALVASVFFMQYMDSTALVTALPQMAISFRTYSENMNIGITAYIMSMAVFIPISGWVACRYGIRRVFTTAIIGFLIASVCCSFCHNLLQFTLSRILQGLAGAMMVPVGRLAVLNSCEKKDLVGAIAWITTPGLIAPIIGPPVGGFLTTYLSWHWIFFINIPLGLIICSFSLRYMPTYKPEEIKKPLDLTGFLLSGIALAGIMYGLELLGSDRNHLIEAFVLLGICFIILRINVFLSNKSPQPLIDYSILSVKTYAITIFYGTVSVMVVSAAPFLLPLMFQDGMGFNAFQSGLMLLALMAGNLLTKPATVWMMHQYGFKYVLIFNTLLLSLSTAFCLFFDSGASYCMMIIILFLMGASRSIQFSTLYTLAFADIPPEKMTSANTFYSTISQMGTGLGIGLGALALRLSLLIEPSTSKRFLLNNYHQAFILIACLGLFSLVGYLQMKASDGSLVSGYSGKN